MAAERRRARPSLRQITAALAACLVVVGVLSALTLGHGTSRSDLRVRDSVQGSLSILRRASVAAAAASVTVSPHCPQPALPAPTFPNGSNQGFGVPFVAALTGGQLYSGYDIQWANEGIHQPFKAIVGPIVGWATGVLQVPSLAATVSPSDITFCDQKNQTPIIATLAQGTDRPSGLFISNIPKTNGYIPFFITAVPEPGTSLKVSGVEPDGALNLEGSAVAATVITLTLGTSTQTCSQYSNNVIGLSSQPLTEPASGPPGLGLAFTPTPLTGPLQGSKANLVGNGFAVPAYHIGLNNCSIGSAFNQEIGGFQADGTANYGPTDTDPVAAVPGWSQFQVKTTIVALGLPVGAPKGFKL